MQFITLLILDLVVAIPCILYYYYWGMLMKGKKTKKMLLEKMKLAYSLTAFVIFFIPTMLLYFLYANILFDFKVLFYQTASIMVILIIVFEYVNYYSFVTFEK